MKKSNYNSNFSQEKLSALRIYLEKKGTTIDKEIDVFLEKSYQKHVPLVIREYILENKNGKN